MTSYRSSRPTRVRRRRDHPQLHAELLECRGHFIADAHHVADRQIWLHAQVQRLYRHLRIGQHMAASGVRILDYLVTLGVGLPRRRRHCPHEELVAAGLHRGRGQPEAAGGCGVNRTVIDSSSRVKRTGCVAGVARQPCGNSAHVRSPRRSHDW